MLNSTSNERISPIDPNISFSNKQNESATIRPKSSMSNRRKSKNSLTPLDPKLYRIAHSGFNNNKIPQYKKKKRKRLVPFSSSSTQAHSHHEQTGTPKEKEKDIEKKRPTPKFVAMKTFNEVKKSWTRTEDSSINLTKLVQIREDKKKKTKAHSQNKKYIRQKSHFSDVFGIIKRNAKSASQQKKKKQNYNKNNNSKEKTDNRLLSPTLSSIQKVNTSGMFLPKIVSPNSAMGNSALKSDKEIENINNDDKQAKDKLSPQKPSSAQIKKQNANNKDSIRTINNSFTFGKEPNFQKKHDQLNTNTHSIGKPKLPGISNKSKTNNNNIRPIDPNNKNKLQTSSPQVNAISVINNAREKNTDNINGSPIKKKSDNNIRGSILNLSSNYSLNENSILNATQERYKKNELQEISNVNKININSVISNNLILNAEIQKSMNELIDNSQCVYCLKRVIHPIMLTCSHEICRYCCDEIISLSNFTKVAQINCPLSIKCPKCKSKTKIVSSIDDLERKNWRPIELSESEKTLEKIQVCEICPSSKYIRDIAEFECLNCDILLCYECRIRHLSNIRHQSHKIIQYHKIVQEKVELTLCDDHREPLKLYCLTDSQPICVICANYEANHKEHTIKTIKNVIDEQSIRLATAIREKESQIRLIEELINQLSYAVGKLEEEKSSFFEKMNKVYGELYEIIKQHEERLKKEVNNIFAGKLVSFNKKLKNLTYIKTRYEYYRNLICEKDIDIIDRVALINKLNHKLDKVDKLGFLLIKNLNSSLADSQLMNIPIKDIDKSMAQFKFLPITQVNITILSTLFASSNIIKKDMILTDLVLLLPKIKSGILLYQVSKDGASTKLFHEKCDNKGPTITIVKTEEGCVFGGFNPMSWISESMYNETEESYLFKLGYGANGKGLKCPVKKYMKHHAIKQNGEGYSPGFGEVDSADLFISYKNLKNSYSNLGMIYKTPKGYDPHTFFAGKSNNWDIVDVEVYAVEVMNEEEYYKIVLS